MIDFHLHSEYSGDSTASLDAMCAAAAGMGLRQIAFTEHLDIGHPDYMFLPDFDGWQARLDEARAKYPSLSIRAGLEAGWTAEHQAQTRQVIQERQWDYIIRSLHVVDGVDPYEKKFFEGKSQKQAYARYLEETYRAVLAGGCYHALGHLNYVAKRAPYPQPALLWQDYPALIDAILEELIRRGKALEVNTSGYRNCGAPLPGLDILRRFRHLGGEMVTLGSDAHEVKSVGEHLYQAALLVRHAGYQQVVGFIAGQPAPIPIEEVLHCALKG